MTAPLALHHFTIADTSPLELVEIAARAGCDAVCIFVDSPQEPAPGQAISRPLFPVVTDAMQREFAGRLKDFGVAVTNIEFFPLAPETDLDVFRDKLALGAELGARLAVTHIHDPDPARATDTLARFGELAAGYELQVGLEFMGLSPACGDLHTAVGYVRDAGQANIGIAIDALHLYLTGGTAADVAALDESLIAYAQLCDSPAYAPEALPLETDRYLEAAFERQVPGEGSLALGDLVGALPGDTFYDVEVPLPTLAKQGVSALERARLAVQGARRFTVG
jgi:sugar phosphate isomerase/epimerase